MKTYVALASLLSVSALSLTPVIAAADPAGINILVRCPTTQGVQNVLTHFGDYIAGYGDETIQNQGSTPIYFKSSALAFGVPGQLGNYHNNGTSYESSSGQVTCNYTSSNPKEPNFAVSYDLTNGKGGTIVQQGKDFIRFVLPVGLRG